MTHVFMKLKNILRFVALGLMIALASVLPVPITFYTKDHLPKHLIERVDKKEEEDEEDEIKALY